MREILLRGKRLDNGKWLYGDLFHGKDGLYIQYFENGEYRSYEVDPSTVGQDTGLTDKNGKKIFDGDILLIENPKPFKPAIELVKFEGCRWVAGVMELDETIYGWPSSIVGNIHDNPELLKEASNAPTN